MSMGTAFRCLQCNMSFHSGALLEKHKSRFCLGPPTANHPKHHHSQPSPHREADMSRIQYDRLTVSRGTSGTPESTWEARASKLKQLHTQSKGMQLLPVPSSGSSAADGDGNPHLSGLMPVSTQRVALSSPANSTNSSISIHVPSDDEEFPERVATDRSHRQRHLQERVDNYGRNLAEYKNKSRALEHQREEIDKRLQELSVGDWDNYTDNTGVLLTELRTQEAKNRRALDDLKHQMKNMNSTRPITSESTLVSEVASMRQAYLRQGGANPAILSQMAQMEIEAANLEDKFTSQNRSRKRKAQKQKDKYSNMEQQITAFELENHRLQNELLLLQETNNSTLMSRAAKDVDAVHLEEADKEIQVRQQEYLHRLAEMEHELEIAKQQARLEKLRKEVDEAESSQRQAPPPPRMPPAQTQPAEVPALVQNQYNPSNMMDADPLQPAPYDPNAGFMTFYDFVTGLDLATQSVRLVVGLYNNAAQYGEPTVLPTVYCEALSSSYYNQGANMATFGAKQPVIRCPPQPDLGLVIELQTAGPGGPLTTKSWCKMALFDRSRRVISGRWRIPLRLPPIRPNISAHELSIQPQHGATEVFIRIVNARDADVQSMAASSPSSSHLYQYPPQAAAVHYPPAHAPYIPPPPSTTPPESLDSVPVHRHQDRSYEMSLDDCTLGFQVDRVKLAEAGEGKVRLTAYYKESGKVVQSTTSPVTCSTTAVKSNFKHRYHMFGQQEASFTEVVMKPDMLLIARFYLRKEAHLPGDNKVNPNEDFPLPAGTDTKAKMYDSETLAAWGVIPLVVPRVKGDIYSGNVRVNTGTKIVPLYEPPVAEPDVIPLEEHWRPKDWRRYGKAALRIHVFADKPRPGSITPSEVSSDDEDSLPEFSWLPYARKKAPSDPYTSKDGFDLYIDGCRHLPDSVTITRVTARVLDRRYERVGRDIASNAQLDSDIYNPVYSLRAEFREPNMAPTSTLLVKVYTIDKFYKQLTVMGYAAINIFVETGTERQPNIDTAGVQISLNEGCHQVRLYYKGPNGIDALSEALMSNSGTRKVPCASLLLRLHKAPIGPKGKPLEANKVPQADWGQLGLWQPRPSYTDRIYQSITCHPTHGECKLLHTLTKRTRISQRESLHMIAEPEQLKALNSDKSAEAFIRAQLTRLMDVMPMDIDLTFISQYNPRNGIKFSLDLAMNLPWSNFTHAVICMNPPGAFYMGQPQGSYDKPFFTEHLDLDSNTKMPAWKDGYKEFRNRTYHRYLCVIIHLQEISVSVSADSYKYGLLEQAWTAVQVFSQGYAHTGLYQLPLFIGSPTPHTLRQISREPLKDWVIRNVETGGVKLADFSSVFVRLADGRREEELIDNVPVTQTVQLNTDYLPPDKVSKFKVEKKGQPITSLVPQGKSPSSFFNSLSTKFKSLVYKLYEEGQLVR